MLSWGVFFFRYPHGGISQNCHGNTFFVFTLQHNVEGHKTGAFSLKTARYVQMEHNVPFSTAHKHKCYKPHRTIFCENYDLRSSDHSIKHLLNSNCTLLKWYTHLFYMTVEAKLPESKVSAAGSDNTAHLTPFTCWSPPLAHPFMRRVRKCTLASTACRLLERRRSETDARTRARAHRLTF